ncbi:purine nucleoside phosphorylase isoform X2 [Helicoverpa armigera]|uniref:purine nucleoside phosphorylase isoform X2 n=1 Tax=Helicoverpa armigera TaxID=29058 RepID=UPI000B37902F|nr:purine nucleoside phosphorylase isoform X2 [Helicoverpa armigera]XP_047026567.1 purine nucleoside phosphorylase-like isoform X2 [Helicoverpa zea]
MAPINANDLNDAKAFVPAKKVLPEVETDVANGNGNGNSPKGYSYETLLEIANFLLSRISVKPHIGIICGSGMGSLAETITDAESISYEDIPNFPVSTVEGHRGQLVFGKISGIPVVAMQGRFHYYEGYPLWKCCLPVRVMKLIGIKALIATNAAGGLNPSYKIGDIMIVKDHINMMGFAGNNPLHGPNDERFGPRFPPMSKAYNYEYRKVAKEIAKELNIDNIVREGVYTCLGGPNFETVAELNMLKMVGVDAVGMSTVHEVITARHCDLNVFALSLITNECVTSYDNDDEANHEEVLDVGRMRQDILRQFVSKLVERFAQIEAKNP